MTLEPDRKGPPGPGATLVLVATLSIVLPYVGIGLCAWGGYALSQGDAGGGQLVALGLACIVLDVLIDFVWAIPALRASEDPTLNRAGADLIGRAVNVVEPIENGRGKVQVADTVWLAEGPDTPAGARVRVVAVRDVVVQVARMDEASGAP